MCSTKAKSTILNIEYIKVQSEAENSFDILSKADFDQICRTCLNQSQLNPIFQLNYNGQPFSTILQSCASVVIKEDDNLPQNICKNCISKTLDLYNYIIQCKQSDLMLKNILKNGGQKIVLSNNDVFELHVEVSDMKDENDIENDSNDDSNPSEADITNRNTKCSSQLQSTDNLESQQIFEKEDSNTFDNEENTCLSDTIKESRVSDMSTKTRTKKIRRRKVQKSLGPPYKCFKCNVSYETLEKFKDHRKQVKHPRSRNNTCTICNKLFTYHGLILHMRTHTMEKPYECKTCGMRFSLKCNLKRHMMTHTGERPHKCKECGKGFIQAGSLREHMKTHTGETPLCAYCGKSFLQAASLKAHLLTHDLEKPMQEDTTKTLQKFQCSICNKTLSSKGVLKTHLLTHGQRKKYLCSVCGKGFCNNTLLQSHVKVHTESKPYPCTVCNKVFSSKPVLKAHLLIHGEKKCLCSICGRGFYSNAGLESHFKVHTGSKPYPCTVCNKSFSQSGSLKSHVLIHTGQKPHVCNVCGKAFTQSSHLKYHTRAHSGERPYECSFCGKSFTSKGTLTVHKRTHTGETPYVCDVCGKGFYDSSSMKKHKRNHVENVQKCISKVDDVESTQTIKC